MMKSFIAFAVVTLAAAAFAAPEVPSDYRYKVDVLLTGLKQPMLLQLAPDGRIFFNELHGKLKILKPNGEVVEAGSVSPFNDQENGFLGCTCPRPVH